MSIERFKEAVRIIGARHNSGHSNVAHNPLYIASTSNGDGELHLDDMREVLAEVERLTTERDVRQQYGDRMKDERDEARAEVERLRGLLADAERHAQERHRERGRDRQAIEIERLREALRSYGAHAPDCGDAHGCTCGYSAALAGSPVETRTETPERIARRIESLLSTPCATPDFLEGVRRAAQRVRAGHLTTVVDAVSEPVETRRALAERVRKLISAALFRHSPKASGCTDFIDALDLDALLEER